MQIYLNIGPQVVLQTLLVALGHNMDHDSKRKKKRARFKIGTGFYYVNGWMDGWTNMPSDVDCYVLLRGAG